MDNFPVPRDPAESVVDWMGRLVQAESDAQAEWSSHIVRQPSGYDLLPNTEAGEEAWDRLDALVQQKAWLMRELRAGRLT